MGSGIWNNATYAAYNSSVGKSYDTITGRVINQSYKAVRIDAGLNPQNFDLRECANSEEHPNTIPVILALDVTGSMGRACNETAEALGVIMTELYDKFKDIEFCVMGIGDLAYDDAPVQMSQFESDVRIAEALDKIYMEKGGGGNGFESYTAAWYMGLKRTRLDCFDKQGRKGIIITMGDEPLNPYLPKGTLNRFVRATEERDIETTDLLNEVSRKFDVFHIAVDDPANSYRVYEGSIKRSFSILGERFKVSTIDNLSKAIVDCISASISAARAATEEAEADMPPKNVTNDKGEITW